MRDILHFLPSTLPNTVGRDDKKSCFDQSHQICHRKQGTKLSFRHSSTLWQMIDNLAPSVTKSMHCSIRTIGNLPWFLTSSTPDDKSTRKCRSGNVPAFFFLVERQASLVLGFGLGQGLFRSFELEIIFSTFGHPELEM